MDDVRRHEDRWLGCCFLDAELIDKGVADGLTPDHFTGYFQRSQWEILCELRMQGKPTDMAQVYAAATESGRVEAIGGLPSLVDSSRTDPGASLNGAAHLSVILAGYAKREAWKIVNRAKQLVEAPSCDLAEVGALADGLVGICAGRKVVHRAVADIAKEAEADAMAVINGTKDERVTVITGFPEFDRKATPMYPHEYVVVGGRSSHGKSSLLNQIVGVNLARGLRVAVFTLETSDKSVIKQLAGQRAGVNLRELDREVSEKQQKYLKALQWLQACKSLLVFDRELTLEAIQARCRLIAQSFRPNLVIIDYLGLVQGAGDSLYERTSAASKAMIPLQKSLGCVLMAGCQLNQESEKDKREPGRTDFRDSGTILDDSHRIIQVWRKPDQHLDNIYFDAELLQVKLRDGPLVKQAVKFHAPTTVFSEGATLNRVAA